MTPLTRTLAGLLLGLGFLVLLSTQPGQSAHAPKSSKPGEKKFTPEEIAFFEKDVKPLLEANCLKCHGGEKTKANLQFTSRAGVLKGGDQGPAVRLDKPDASLLLRAISYSDKQLEMPPKGKLPQKEIDTLTKWVKA